MSYDVLAIAVDLDNVRAAIGSKDEKLLAELTEVFEEDLAQIEELQGELLDAEAGPYAGADALRDLLAGGPYRDDAGLAYYFCFEILCRHFGDTMDSDAWSSIKSKWFEEVRDGLKQAGLKQKETARLAYIPFSGPPVELPETGEYPNLGYLTKDEVVTARATLAATDLSKVEDEEVCPAIEQLASWLDECAKSNRDLVCTYA